MGLHIVLCDHVQAVDIAKPVDHGIVGVMTGPDRVNIIALHDHNVCNHIFPSRRSPGFAGELMAVSPVEYDTPAVQLHETVLHLKMTESHKF